MRRHDFIAGMTLAVAVLTAVSVRADTRRLQTAPKTVLDVMIVMTVPASNAIFEVTDPPATPAAWQALASHAATIIESGALLLAPSRAPDQGEWVNQVRLHVDSATRVAKAVETRNVEALLAASDSLAESCVTCHKVYLAK
jgi:hypothetical protein